MATTEAVIERPHLSTLKKKRGGFRGYVTHIKSEVEEIVKRGKPENPQDFQATKRQLNALLEQAETRWKNEDDVNDAILNLMNDDDFDAEMMAQEKHKDERVILRALIRDFLGDSNSHNQHDSTQRANATSVPVAPVAVPAPYHQPEIREFDGSVFKFQSWWEAFDANINSHPTMPTSTKFTFLDKSLKGKAAAAVAKVGRIDAHYEMAIQILKKRFGNVQATTDQLIAELLDAKPVTDSNDVEGLRELLDLVETNVGMLKNLGRDQSTYVSIIRSRLISKLPLNIAFMWHERPDRLTASIDDFIAFLTVKVVSREEHMLSLISQETDSKNGNQAIAKKKIQHATAAELVNKVETRKSSKRQCQFCAQDHRPTACDLPIAKRRECATKQGRCFNCLSKGHTVSDCKCDVNCRKCNGRHHSALCKEDKSLAASNEADTRRATTKDKGSIAVKTANVSCVACSQREDVLLQTATVLLEKADGTTRKITCLLDLGSQRTIIRESLATSMQLPAVEKELIAFIGLGEAHNSPKWRKRRVCRIKGIYPGAKFISIEALETSFITNATPAIKSEFSRYLVGNGNWLADERYQTDADDELSVDLLIGADEYWKIVEHDIKKSGNGVVATNSKLGWLLSGPVQHTFVGRSARATSMLIKTLRSQADSANKNGADKSVLKLPMTKNVTEIEEISSLAAFFELEHIGIRDQETGGERAPKLSERIDPEIIQLSNGRFQVPLPWNSNRDQLQSNRPLAEKRLRSLLTRLSRDPDLLTEYDQQLKNFIELGYLAEVTGSASDPEYYLPHLAVIRPDKTSHRLRIVFDASAKARNGLSLNDCVEVGDNLYPDMLAILLRFGWNSVGWIGDITKAFLQMELKPEDRSACRVLWVKDINNPLNSSLTTYQWTRVTFGIASSPFLLTATIHKLLRKFEGQYPGTTASIFSNMFVDDWIGGAENPQEAFKRIKEAIKIFDDAKFSMGKWSTNCSELQQLLIEGGFIRRTEECASTQADGIVSGLFMNDSSKVLGLKWNLAGDYFYFDPEPLIKELENLVGPLTKRKFLKISAKLFDPIGYLAPLIVRVKMLFQELWKAKIDWDAPIPTQINKEWGEFIRDLVFIKKIQIPRYYFKNVNGRMISRQIHVFGDASKSAYGSVAYLRVVGRDGEVIVRFISSKSRVAPVKGCTMPRMELLASLITARLADYLRNALNLHDWRFFLWTDSTVARAWLTKTNTGQLLPWVRNRVEEVKKLFAQEVWFHCPGVENPADIVSRGILAEDLVNNALWWSGPTWLKNEPDWPQNRPLELSSEEEHGYRAEITKKAVVNVVEVAQLETLPWNRFGNMKLLLKTLAWARRFISCASGKVNPMILGDAMDSVTLSTGRVSVHTLTGNEIHFAEIDAIRCVQLEEFPKERAALMKGEYLPRGSSIIDLRPIWDQDEKIMRVTGRVSPSYENLGVKPPILLPPNHHFVYLMIDAVHLKLNHSGFKATFAEIKKRFWIIKGRSVVKKIIGKCVICSKYNSRCFQEQAADLPIDRSRLTLPFEVVGVDYAGPLYVKARNIPGDLSKESPIEIKAYFLIFTCAATRAVRFELVPDQSTDTFILAFRRFVAGTSGTVSILYSDNARTFRKADKYLERVFRNSAVQGHLTNRRIDWRFIASRAPWWGGFWERMIKTTKDLLRKILQRSALRWDEMSTILKELELIINNRPLGYSEEEELTPLTPAMMISGIRVPFLPEKPAPPVEFATSSFETLVRREKHRLTLLERCWQRWKTEYLHDLAHFHYRARGGRKIKLGDVVLIHNDKKRMTWEMGVVTKLHIGNDGLTRSVDVRTGKGVLTRPVQKLYPTEVQAGDTNTTGNQQDLVNLPNFEPVLTEEHSKSTPLTATVPEVEDEEAPSTGEYVGTVASDKIFKFTRRGRSIKRPLRYRK